ncbi:MAG: hypothetical protein Q8S84_04330 [bacterium]|nr:hypothetical protein [bacterium]
MFPAISLTELVIFSVIVISFASILLFGFIISFATISEYDHFGQRVIILLLCFILFSIFINFLSKVIIYIWMLVY